MKFITLTLLTRFWTKVKQYIDTALSGKAAANHTHSGYATSDHTHTGYASASHTHAYGDLSGTPTIPTTVAQLSDSGNYALKTDLASLYKYKGSKANNAALPNTGNAVGDVWNVEDSGMNFGWTGSEWDALGSTVSITEATEAEIDAIFTA